MIKKNIVTDELIATILQGIDNVKGEDVQLLDLRKLENTVCEYFIVCSANSNTQVNAISGAVQKLVSKELKDKPWHVEGQGNAEWVLIDYVSVVLHVFQKHTREYYNIEDLWGDAEVTKINLSDN